MEYVTYDTFKKMDMRVGTIREVAPVEGADKLLKFQIEFGTKLAPVEKSEDGSDLTAPIPEETAPSDSVDSPLENGEPLEGALPEEFVPTPESIPDIRQIVSGIREFYPEYEKLVGKQVLYIVNLEPRTIRGEVSNGMLMAVDGKDGRPVFLMPEVEVTPGASVR